MQKAAVRASFDYKQTMKGIDRTRTLFFQALSERLNLQRVAAPLFIPGGTGIQDTLFKTESKIRFDHDSIPGKHFETLHSLAKWKRHTLTEQGFEPHSGIWVEGHYVRGFEPSLDETHSIYVLQFDWEMTIRKEDRTVEFLKSTVSKIYDGIKATEEGIVAAFPDKLSKQLPADIHFIHTEELEKLYPSLSPRDREIAITKEKGAVFIIGIGHPLPGSGKPHDDRAADYDDWWTANTAGYRGLNGDILVWDTALDTALELSSMGIRVCPQSLKSQSEIQGTWDETKDLHYHKRVSTEDYVYSIGGGIGIDRVTKWMLRKRHIGEVQVSIWPEETLKAYPAILQ